MSSRPGKARTAMYKWLATQLDIDYEKCHVKWFNRDQCKQAIKILKAKHIQLYGKDIPWEEAKKRMEKEEIEELANEFSGSYWNYRWIKTIVDMPEYDDDGNLTGKTDYESYYELHEVYYDKDEAPFMWTQDVSNMQVENAIDLMEFIKSALNAAKQPVLLFTEDKNKVEETEEYIDGMEELDKWLANKQD